MKKSIIIFAAASVLSVGMIVFGWFFVDQQIGEAVLTEETILGDKGAADGLAVGFRADAADNLHWVNQFIYSTDKSSTAFTMGEMDQKIDTSVYDEIRFTGWSTVPYVTKLSYGPLEGLQDQEIQGFYDKAQKKFMESGAEQTGKIKVKDYLKYYPVSFHFQFGNRSFDSDQALTGLKIYDESGKLTSETGTDYDEDVALYAALNHMFRIPVIENEYQEYRISKPEQESKEEESLSALPDKLSKKKNKKQGSLNYVTEIKKPLGQEEDFYEFDPVIVIQEENLLDETKWVHPDLAAGGEGAVDEAGGGEAGDGEDSGEKEDYAVKSASAYNLKNRMLLVVNNRTAKGKSIDISQMKEGYGIYELPIEVTASASVRKGRRSFTVPAPKPLSNELAMVYPLDEEAEYVEMSLSGDHRYLAVFSVKNGSYLVEMIDADMWTSDGPVEVFPASQKMTYAWGKDGTLALTNHEGNIAVLTRTVDKDHPYEILYSGKSEDKLDQQFFDAAMVSKDRSYARYQYGNDTGLAIAARDGKVALIQNILTGDAETGVRNAALACAIIDQSGVLYSGHLKSNLVDLEYDMSAKDIEKIKALQDDTAMMIQPVRNENWCRWEQEDW